MRTAVTIPTLYVLRPTESSDRFAVLCAERQIADLTGEWVVRMYRLLQGEGDAINCYQGANFVIKHTLEFDGKKNRQMLMKGGEIPFADAVKEFPQPFGVQWGTKDLSDRNPRKRTNHSHSAVVIHGETVEDSLIFEIPGYDYTARISTYAEVDAREMAKGCKDIYTVHRHFYSEPIAS